MVTPAEAIPYLNILIYGEPGAGKTYLAGTAQDSKHTSPILFLDVEGGTVTLRKKPGIDVVRIKKIEDVVDIYNKLAADKSGYYKTVVIDSLSEVQKLDLRFCMDEEYNKKPDSIDRDVATLRSWGKSGERMRRIIRAYRDLPMNTIMTSLVASEKDEQTGVVQFFPMFPGKLRGEVPGYFDIVGLLQSKEDRNGEVVTRSLQVTKTTKVVAKDRTDSLDPVVQNPTIPGMWEVINKS